MALGPSAIVPEHDAPSGGGCQGGGAGQAGLARGLRRGIASRAKAGHDLDHDGSAKNIGMKSAIGGARYCLRAIYASYAARRQR